MSLSREQLEQHCKTILQARRILNKIVVLCEGDIPKIQGRPSPQSYGKMEEMPDSNFYKACVPQCRSQYRPQFFNCGDRRDVIDTYFSLLELHNIDMADKISSDLDLQNNSPRVFNRISCCSGLDCSEIEKLQDSWKDQFQKAGHDTRKDELVFALLTIKKAKNYWHQVQPPSDWTRPPEVFREQLSLKIGRFYSEHSNDPKYHIPFFLKTLYDFV